MAVDFITQCLDDGKLVCASFLDFHKAFDSLAHHLLLDKLFQLNVQPEVVPKLFVRPLAPCEGCQWFFRVEDYERRDTPRVVPLVSCYF